MDHDLPAPFPLVASILRLEERESPLFEQVDARVHVPRDVIHQVLSTQPHEVLPDIPHEVLGLVFPPLHPQIAVDSGQAHRHRSAFARRRPSPPTRPEAPSNGPSRPPRRPLRTLPCPRRRSGHHTQLPLWLAQPSHVSPVKTPLLVAVGTGFTSPHAPGC